MAHTKKELKDRIAYLEAQLDKEKDGMRQTNLKQRLQKYRRYLAEKEAEPKVLSYKDIIKNGVYVEFVVNFHSVLIHHDKGITAVKLKLQGKTPSEMTYEKKQQSKQFKIMKMLGFLPLNKTFTVWRLSQPLHEITIKLWKSKVKSIYNNDTKKFIQSYKFQPVIQDVEQNQSVV